MYIYVQRNLSIYTKQFKSFHNLTRTLGQLVQCLDEVEFLLVCVTNAMRAAGHCGTIGFTGRFDWWSQPAIALNYNGSGTINLNLYIVKKLESCLYWPISLSGYVCMWTQSWVGSPPSHVCLRKYSSSKGVMKGLSNIHMFASDILWRPSREVYKACH